MLLTKNIHVTYIKPHELHRCRPRLENLRYPESAKAVGDLETGYIIVP